MPLFVRKFIVDFVETALGMLLALNIAFPHDITATQQAFVVIATALGAAAVSAFRREVPDFLVWFKSKLGTS